VGGVGGGWGEELSLNYPSSPQCWLPIAETEDNVMKQYNESGLQA
jgi:hypothetical protein